MGVKLSKNKINKVKRVKRLLEACKPPICPLLGQFWIFCEKPTLMLSHVPWPLHEHLPLSFNKLQLCFVLALPEILYSVEARIPFHLSPGP